MDSMSVPPCASGIYRIRNAISGRFYVGSARNIKRRWWEHTWMLKKGSHYSKLMQNSWDKNGEDAFIIEVLEIVADTARLLEREQYWINALDAFNSVLGMNLSPTAGSNLGVKYSAEHNAKISARRKGSKASLETRKKLSEALKGRTMPPRSPEHRAKISAANLRRPPMSLETRAKMSASHIGKKYTMSAEHRKNLSIAKLGKRLSPEAYAKGAAARRGAKRTLETRAKIAAALKGRIFTAEHRAAISAARRKMKKSS